MTKDEIIEMWKNSGDLEIIGMPYSMIEGFAKLVAEKEREACAKVCEDYGRAEEMQAIGNDYATAIRARGQV
jgi:hypothetical protein